MTTANVQLSLTQATFSAKIRGFGLANLVSVPLNTTASTIFTVDNSEKYGLSGKLETTDLSPAVFDLTNAFDSESESQDSDSDEDVDETINEITWEREEMLSDSENMEKYTCTQATVVRRSPSPDVGHYSDDTVAMRPCNTPVYEQNTGLVSSFGEFFEEVCARLRKLDDAGFEISCSTTVTMTVEECAV